MHPTTAFPTTVDESGLGVREAIAADERPEPIVEFAIGSDCSVPASERPNSDHDDAQASADSAASITGSSTISVAIPAYNEAEAIVEVVVETREYAEEVVVIDDGSADDTAARAYDAGATMAEHDHNEGYGAALRTAFETADRRGVDHLVMLNGDGQHDPADIPRLVTCQAETDAEIVIGSRFVDGYESAIPAFRRFGIQVINALTNLSIGVRGGNARVSDTQSGFRAYDARAIESLADDRTVGKGMGASIDVLHHAHRRGYDIEEIGTVVAYDVENGSTHHSVRHGFGLLTNLLGTIGRDHPIESSGVDRSSERS